jgi:uncharacterized membrane protein
MTTLGAVHVAAACVALLLGVVALVRRKGDPGHVALGRVYLVAMLLVNLPALMLYRGTGRPGPFHVLAVVSLTTTLLGLLSIRRGRRDARAVAAHAALMSWSWIGVATAGVAQWAHHQMPNQAPWPVALTVGFATVIGLVSVRRYTAQQLVRLRR